MRDVYIALVVDHDAMRVDEGFVGFGEFAEAACCGVVDGFGAAGAADDLVVGIQHGDPAVEHWDVHLAAVAEERADTCAGDGDGFDVLAVERETLERVLFTRGDEQRGVVGVARVDDAAVWGLEFFGFVAAAAEGSDEFAGGAVLHDVVEAVPVEDVEVAVGGL